MVTVEAGDRAHHGGAGAPRLHHLTLDDRGYLWLYLRYGQEAVPDRRHGLELPGLQPLRSRTAGDARMFQRPHVITCLFSIALENHK